MYRWSVVSKAHRHEWRKFSGIQIPPFFETQSPLHCVVIDYHYHDERSVSSFHPARLVANVGASLVAFGREELQLGSRVEY